MNQVIISSLAEFVGEICKLNSNTKKAIPVRNDVLLYRGHSDKSYMIAPSLSRGRNGSTSISLFNYERDMIEMAQYKRPDIFRADLHPLEILALLQHYEMPTRLLDVSENPMVALYFACNTRAKKGKDGKLYIPDGEVIVFTDNETSTSTYPIVNAIADTYHIIGSSNTEMTLTTFLEIATKQPYFSEQCTLAKTLLSREIENDKDAPDFMKTPDSWIKSCCENPLFVYAPIRLQRQQAQSGRYILFPNRIVPSLYDQSELAFTSEILPIEKDSSCINTIFIIPADKKAEILKELNMFGINKETLFPDNIDVLCESIKNKFSSLL